MSEQEIFEKLKKALDYNYMYDSLQFGEELKEQGITSGTKVLVRTRTWYGDEVDTVTYFFGVSIELGKIK